MNDRYSKLAFLHRVKERKTPSLSAQASFAPFSLKVAWSGKSLIPTLDASETGGKCPFAKDLIIFTGFNQKGECGTLPCNILVGFDMDGNLKSLIFY